MAVYAIVACAAVIENIFPPAPADVVIALAAFLSHRGSTEPITVFLVTWIANVGGAGMVYLFARRYGRTFFASRLGRSLMTPEAVVTVEREYLRLGAVGLFVARLLPGLRTFTAPFAGLVRLGPVRAFLPIALASGLWYGGIVLISARLGRNWDAVMGFITALNRAFGGVAILVLLVAVILIVVRRRRKARRELEAELAGVLGAHPALGERALADPAVAAVAALLLETVEGDRGLTQDELGALAEHLGARLGLPAGPTARPPLDAAAASGLIARLEPAVRVGIATRLRDLIFGEGGLERHEARVMERIRQLLGLDPGDLPGPGERASP